jgi:glycolate oxidase
MIDQKILDELERIFGKANILTSKINLEAYSYDSSPFFGAPKAVVFAENAQQISRFMRFASKGGIPVIPRGAGTSLSGGCIAQNGEIILALNRLNRILEIDPLSETAWVEPGVINVALQEALAPYGFMYAPDPGSFRVSTIGGNVVEGAGGMRGVKYGVAKDHFLGAEAVLADGTIVQLGEYGKFYPGIDVTGMFCASEGTFGILTKIRVKLTRLAEATSTMMAAFDKLQDAGSAVSAIISNSIVPVTLEIMDKRMVQAVDDFLHLGLPRDAEALLLIELDGCKEEMQPLSQRVMTICQQNGATNVELAQTEAQRQDLWKARRSGNGALGRIKPAYMVQDVTVPRHKLPKMLEFVTDVAKRHDIIITQLAHAGDGNLHPHLLYDPKDPQEYERVEKAAEEIFKKAIEVGGTLTGEHGIGLEKKKYMPLAFTADDMDFMGNIKAALDPELLLNSDKILDIQRCCHG